MDLPSHDTGGGAGAAMPGDVQAKMERAFQADFSAVRIHQGPHVRGLGALGYTQGTDIHFAPGRYAPDSHDGQALLGHELAHVVQQSQGRVAPGPQAKGGSINADPALEREADEQGERAARGELVAPGQPAQAAPIRIASAAAPAIQRFEDPDMHVEVDAATIAHHADAVRYAKAVQDKRLRMPIAEFKVLMSRLKQLETQELGASVVEGMGLANGQDGPSYHHNVDPMVLAGLVQTGQQPELGYANPAHFDRVSKFTWRVKQRHSAAAALRAFLAPALVTVSECQTALQAALYHAVLAAVGDAKFDSRLGSTEADIPDADRLILQMDFQPGNPLAKYLEDLRVGLDPQEKSELRQDDDSGHLISEPDHRPAKVGGWYYMKNHAFYSERHRGGLWGGENSIYVGRNQDGAQVFSGFGLADRTEAEMAQALANECNRAPTAERSEALFLQRKFGLALPRLGDLSSIATMPMTQQMIQVIDNVWNESGRLRATSPNERFAKDRLKGLLKDAELPQPVTAADILHTIDTEHLEGIGNEAQNETLTNKRVQVAWADGVTDGDAPCKVMTIKKTTDNQVRLPLSDVVKLYCTQFSLEYLAKDMVDAFKRMNPDLGPNIEITKPGIPIRFPPPEVYIRRHVTPAGFQTLGGRTLSIDKIKNEFGLVHLYDHG